jgi:DNA primase
MMLEEGINVKVVLLPEGEDPDSFARKHNANEVLEYIKKNQTDFIRFKTQLLSDEAGNDPIKKAEMIIQIVESIAIIPDIIKRQVYIKDCATTLQIPEQVLIKKVIEIRKRHLEEQKKKERPIAPTPTIEAPDAPATPETSEQPITPQEPTNEKSNKDRNIRNIMQLIIRHGEKVIYQDEQVTVRAGEYIISELKKDNITIDNPLYSQIIDEYLLHYQEPNWVTANHFQYHPNAEVSQFAVNMLADKYQLSRMYAKQAISENVVKEVELPTEVDILPEMVQRMLLELKYTIVNERIDSVQLMLQEAEARKDNELTRTILEQLPVLFEIRQQLCKALGNRVIVG